MHVELDRVVWKRKQKGLFLRMSLPVNTPLPILIPASSLFVPLNEKSLHTLANVWSPPLRSPVVFLSRILTRKCNQRSNKYNVKHGFVRIRSQW
jgi:hypothetical protein